MTASLRVCHEYSLALEPALWIYFSLEEEMVYCSFDGQQDELHQVVVPA